MPKKPAELNEMHRCCADCHLFIRLPSTPYSEEEDMSPEYVINYRYSEADLENPLIQKVKINGADYRYQEIEILFREAIKQETKKCSELFGEYDLLRCYAPKCRWKESESMGTIVSTTDEGRHKTIVETNRNDCSSFYEYTPGMDLEIARGDRVTTVKEVAVSAASFEGKQPEGEDGRKKTKAKKGKLRTGGKKVYIPDKELKPFLNGILKEFKGFSHSLSDLAGIAQKRIKEKYGSHKLKNGKVKEYYSVGRLKVFFSNLKNKGQLR